MPRVTRVEVIDRSGRVYVAYYEPGIEVHVQDDGRTVKIFAGERSGKCPTYQAITEKADLAEQGRRLASEREDLIAAGVDPALLEIPLHPRPPLWMREQR